MLHDYNNHLAAAILNDGKCITYRLLSRELKVHSNIAKKMLYDFHRKQNAKRPGSVCATYLIDGTPKPIANSSQTNGHPTDEDMHMQSSPFTSSAVQHEDKEEELAIPSRSLTLAREEDLQAAKLRFQTIHSIHVYSLQPNVLQNLQTLSDCNSTIATMFATEDPLIVGQQYGAIHNSRVRRRIARHVLGLAPSMAAMTKMEDLRPNPTPRVSETAKAKSKTERLSSQESTVKSEINPVGRLPSKFSSKTPGLKKEQSDIFKSFSRPKPTLKNETTDSSALESSAAPSQESADSQEDTNMKDASDEDQQEDIALENKADPNTVSMRSQRQQQLRNMMDQDDDEVGDTDKQQASDASQEPAAFDEAPDQTAPASEPIPVMSGRRRRGRRKVIKRKTIKDEEGYLVTKEEPAWESFSEDEPVSQKDQAPASSTASFKGKKTTGSKPGQGNIMSFFGKK